MEDGKTFKELAKWIELNPGYADLHKLEICVSLQVEGMHRWPDAAKHAPRVAFLANPHRHIFFIRAWKVVSNQDREIEIILLKRQMLEYMRGPANGEVVDFGSMSCEHIALTLKRAFGLSRCQVLEDDENGAEVSIT